MQFVKIKIGFSVFDQPDMGLVLRVSSDSGHRDLTSSSLDFSSQAKSSSSKRLEHGYGLIFAFSFAEVDGLPVCSAEIPAIDLSERPCYYKGAGRMKGSYIRVGDADLPMTDYELYSYEAFRKHLHDDERPIQRASLSTLNQDVLQRYLLERRAERPGFGRLDEVQQMKMLNITRN